MPTQNRRTILTITCILVVTAVMFSFDAQAEAAGHQYGEMVDYPLVFPVAGPATFIDSFYAARYNGDHHAQDLMADKMTPVVAAASGTIIRVNGETNARYIREDKCCTLGIRHDDGWETRYIHLNNDNPGTDDGQGWGIAPGITVGVHVEAGQLIGWVGDSGNAENTAPHLHFELHDPNGVIVNPYQALRAAQGAEPVCTRSSNIPLDTLLNGSRLLRRGTTGTEVSELQGFLNLEGHEVGPIDGIFGSRTDAGVRSFQRAQSLVVDGLVGSQTRAAIADIAEGPGFSSLADPAGPVLRPGEARGPEVRELQEWLRVAGYDPGPIDGIYGNRTASAVKDLQEAAGIFVDGKVGPNTRAALAQVLGLTSLATCS
jgi:peptidoglycan hydrolase-like protein with peptidoglycan-binding domain